MNASETTHRSTERAGGAHSGAGVGAEVSLWGLGAAELHAAFWSSHGVACVMLGSRAMPQEEADLYLLMEPNQGVNFDLRRIAESLLWNQAHVTRLHTIERESAAYSERVILDGDGFVQRIERRYGSDRNLSGQVLLGTRRDDAIAWSQSDTAREAFARIRRERRLRIDSTECAGERFDLATPDGAAGMVRSLAREWANPHHVIKGIVEVEDGVFAPESFVKRPDDRFVPPVWIGAMLHDTERPSARSDGSSVSGTLAIGPACIWDARPTAAAHVVPIKDLFAAGTEGRSDSTPDASGWYSPIKRALDVVLSIAVLVFFAPVMLLCCIAVVVDDGFPIFFGHKRQTKGGSTFRCWKFRTMRRNAEALVAELRKQNLCDGPQVNIKDDPRVTRVGRYLRKLQLDEFPQFWNVLIGDMSIVGPRPSPDNENQFCPAWRETRLSVRPGITGLWQVKRTREQGKDFQEWIQYDIEYVERMGLLFDLWICILTVVNIVARR